MDRIVNLTQRMLNLSIFAAILATFSWAQDTRYVPSTFHDQLLTRPRRV